MIHTGLPYLEGTEVAQPYLSDATKSRGIVSIIATESHVLDSITQVTLPGVVGRLRAMFSLDLRDLSSHSVLFE